LLEDSDSFLTVVTAFSLELESKREHTLERHQVDGVIIDTKDSLFTELGALGLLINIWDLVHDTQLAILG
jgi:hypothetical protein